MKYLTLMFVLLIASCVKVGDREPARPDLAFDLESQESIGTYYDVSVIREISTGRRFLITSFGSGVSVVEITYSGATLPEKIK